MKRNIDLSRLGDLVDVSAVKADATQGEIDEMIRIVRQYHCVCAAPMAWAAEYTAQILKNESAVVTGVVGFPSGAELSIDKAMQAQHLIERGCEEIDMVMNIGAFKSRKYETVAEDIMTVVAAAGNIPVKVILEVSYLTDDEIRYGSELLVKSGAAYVKTGTGWGPKPTTIDTIGLIKETIGDAAKIKAAGGVRDLATLKAMYEVGCDRFGLGVRTAEKILSEAKF
ncbi:MAG: deoxyribose-phosphate aldolase [Eubacteriales bacterium]|nr:deoxyribose-phosphate aldolase [Eubacteriales bacterium]